MQTITRIILTTLVALVIFSGGAGVGYAFRDYWVDDQPTDTEAADFSLYWEVWHRVKEQFYGDIPEPPQPTYGAIRGMLETLNDPYTVFIEPDTAAHEKAQLEGQFGGIGAFVRQDEQGRVILEPMRGQPAEKAGIQTNDILIAVDGTPLTPEMTLDDIVLLIRGEVGTEVVLTVQREGVADPIDITVVRAIIETPSAFWRILEEDPNIGYIQLTSFTERSNTELNQAFDELTDQGAQAFIFDLRNNGGGLLETAIDVASQFIRSGVILQERRKNGDETVYRARSGGRALDQPLVVLVNGGTASASEIVAGALKDYGRAVLVGEKTFGKGSVQLIYELSDKSRLHVTVAKWFTPKGNAIDGVGLTPDIEVPITEEDRTAGRDPQLERGIAILQGQLQDK
ncbi:MAG: S41 family peptidase [Chloroflexi bacterium]|nr:MAG: S41 family peptidase [Chloroflexota bacterium]